jgi:uncharacterized protein (DUF1778 family)
MRPKKGKAERKDKIVQIRLTEDQRKTLQTAADLAGADLSTWMRIVALEQARRNVGPV